MRTMVFMKYLWSLFLVAISFAIFSSPIFAQDNSNAFDTQLESTYTVASDGTTTVLHSITITNTTATTFIKQYALKTSFPELENIIVKNNGEEIVANVVHDDNSTSIGVTFPDEIVGEGKKRTFSIEYRQKDLATVGGKVLEIHIPEIADKNVATNHQVLIKTPTNFGAPVRSTPEPDSISNDSSGFITTYSVNKDTPISALYGSEQTFNLTLRYNLENTTTSTGITQVALPPDTAFQKMYYQSIDPLPEKMERDEDGNWIATYRLEPNTATTVYVVADVHLTLDPQKGFSAPAPLPGHTQPQKFWDSKAKVITDIASKEQTPEAIYSYVVDTLSYSYAAVNKKQDRLGAVTAIEHPESAVCQEFTDVFISLARANGIPSRRLTGYAHTENTALRPLSLAADILHAWPEYYDQETGVWKQVDPTWGNTTNGIDYFHQFDLNHIVFAINGLSSTTPYAAGSYKTNNFETKDVEVEFTEEPKSVEPSFSVTSNQESLFTVGVPGRGSIIIENNTGVAWYDVSIAATSESNTTVVPAQTNLPAVLPFETVKIPTTLISDHIWQSSKTPIQVTVSVADKTYDFSIELQSGPFFVKELTEQRVVYGLVASITLLTLVAGSILVFRRR